MFRNLLILIIFGLILANIGSVPTPLSEVENWEIQDYGLEPIEMDPNDTLSTALVTIASIIEANQQNLNFDLYPTLHNIIMGPFTAMSRAFADILKGFDQRSIFDVLSFSTLKSTVMLAPQRVVQYWTKFIEMEKECMFRTICDLSAYVSPRLPYWMNQVMGIYFTTHSVDNMYFRAVANGMINSNCTNYYPQCSPNAFSTFMKTK